MSSRDQVRQGRWWRIWLAVWVVGFSLLVNSFVDSLAHAANGEVGAVNLAIQARGGRWQAGTTSVSQMSPAARKRLLGTIKPQIPRGGVLRGPESLQAPPVGEAPPSLDWRNYGGEKFVTPIRNQGNCGSCWAFATVAALESQALIANHIPGTNVDLSEQAVVSCSGAGDCSGGFIDGASDFLRDAGAPLESCLRYTATEGSCGNACAGWQNYSYRITDWRWVTTDSPTVDDLKNALNTYGPLTTTMDVYEDFYHYISGVYSYVSGSYQGGHAILLVGYDDAGQYFIVKNSWGTGWGEAGYFKIAYSELANLVSFGYFTIAYEGFESITPACSYTLVPARKKVKAVGGISYVSLATQLGCNWTAQSNVSWISITSETGGSGSRTIFYAVSPNTGPARTGTLTLGGQTFTVNQRGTRVGIPWIIP